MSDHGRKPVRWANDLQAILAAVFGEGRFPVPIEDVAAEYSRKRFPGDPVVAIEGRELGTFEGALYPVQERKGWAIIYNTAVSEGRRRFTIAHEFGHYLMHRKELPEEGLECSEQAITFRDGLDLEQEADAFAAYLLMPFDDFRRQLPADIAPDLDTLSTLATRYGVSLISCIIRWLEYTERRSMIVVSRDGFVLWSKSSQSALRTGLFFRTRRGPTTEVPSASLVHRRDFSDIARDGVQHPAGVWFSEECTEITVHSDKYDQVITVLHFGRAPSRNFAHDEPEDFDTFDQFNRRERNRFGDT